MMKEAVRALETGAFAEIGLVAFFVAFVLVVAYAFTLSKQDRDELKRQPLDDAPDDGFAIDAEHPSANGQPQRPIAT